VLDLLLMLLIGIMDDIQELLRLTRENNIMLRHIVSYIHKDDTTEFIKNIVANLISNNI
jgi:hypothetical protein